MAETDDTMFLFIGTYDTEAEAQEDYAIAKELHAAGVIGGYDAAVIRKDDKGKIHVNKDETATRKGAWGGAVVGAALGVIFPPSIIATAAVGAAAGGLGGHILKGLSRSDVKEIGELLENGESALLVIGDWQLEKAVDKMFAHAEKRVEKEIRGLERAQIEEANAAAMRGDA